MMRHPRYPARADFPLPLGRLRAAILTPGRSTSAMNFRWNFSSFNKIFLTPAPLGTVVWREIPRGLD